MAGKGREEQTEPEITAQKRKRRMAKEEEAEEVFWYCLYFLVLLPTHTSLQQEHPVAWPIVV